MPLHVLASARAPGRAEPHLGADVGRDDQGRAVRPDPRAVRVGWRRPAVGGPAAARRRRRSRRSAACSTRSCSASSSGCWPSARSRTSGSSSLGARRRARPVRRGQPLWGGVAFARGAAAHRSTTRSFKALLFLGAGAIGQAAGRPRARPPRRPAAPDAVDRLGVPRRLRGHRRAAAAERVRLGVADAAGAAARRLQPRRPGVSVAGALGAGRRWRRPRRWRCSASSRSSAWSLLGAPRSDAGRRRARATRRHPHRRSTRSPRPASALGAVPGLLFPTLAGLAPGDVTLRVAAGTGAAGHRQPVRRSDSWWRCCSVCAVVLRATSAARRSAPPRSGPAVSAVERQLAWTSAGFTKPLRLVLEAVLRPSARSTLEENTAGVRRITLSRRGAASLRHLLYEPVAAAGAAAARRSRGACSPAACAPTSLYLLALVLVLLALRALRGAGMTGADLGAGARAARRRASRSRRWPRGRSSTSRAACRAVAGRRPCSPTASCGGCGARPAWRPRRRRALYRARAGRRGRQRWSSRCCSCRSAGTPPTGASGTTRSSLVGLLALGRFAIAVAAWDTGSGFALMGAGRDLTFAVFAEGVLLLVILLAALTAGGSTDLVVMSDAASGSAPWQEPVHWCAAVAFALVALAETGRQPVDNPDTHLELTMIHEGPLLEYAGRDLACLQWAASARLWLMLRAGGRAVPAEHRPLRDAPGDHARGRRAALRRRRRHRDRAGQDAHPARAAVSRRSRRAVPDRPGQLAGRGWGMSTELLWILVGLALAIVVVRRRTVGIGLLAVQSLLLGAAAVSDAARPALRPARRRDRAARARRAAARAAAGRRARDPRAATRAVRGTGPAAARLRGRGDDRGGGDHPVVRPRPARRRARDRGPGRARHRHRRRAARGRLPGAGVPGRRERHLPGGADRGGRHPGGDRARRCCSTCWSS